MPVLERLFLCCRVRLRPVLEHFLRLRGRARAGAPILCAARCGCGLFWRPAKGLFFSMARCFCCSSAACVPVDAHLATSTTAQKFCMHGKGSSAGMVQHLFAHNIRLPALCSVPKSVSYQGCSRLGMHGSVIEACKLLSEAALLFRLCCHPAPRGGHRAHRRLVPLLLGRRDPHHLQ